MELKKLLELAPVYPAEFLPQTFTSAPSSATPSPLASNSSISSPLVLSSGYYNHANSPATHNSNPFHEQSSSFGHHADLSRFSSSSSVLAGYAAAAAAAAASLPGFYSPYYFPYHPAPSLLPQIPLTSSHPYSIPHLLQPSLPHPHISTVPIASPVQLQLPVPAVNAAPLMASLGAFPTKPQVYRSQPEKKVEPIVLYDDESQKRKTKTCNNSSNRTQPGKQGRGRGRPRRESPASSSTSSSYNPKTTGQRSKRKKDCYDAPTPSAAKRSKIVEPIDDNEGHLIIKIGMDLGLQYKVLGQLGEGTFGKVVMCQDRLEGGRVAIKIIKSIQKYRDAAMCEISVFDAIQKNDPECDKGVIHLRKWFEHQNHVCMVFDLLGQSVFDFLKDNLYSPFPLSQIHEFTRQILASVSFLHSLKLIHTDLKPENILLVNSDFKVTLLQNSAKTNRSLLSTELKVIDFGSTIFENDYHSTVVCTRHYRAPEIILGLGWSFPCDLWSIGCILLELYTGEALFQTHENLEHLAMMERILGKIPLKMTNSDAGRRFYERGSLKYPDKATTYKSEKRVEKLKKFDEMAKGADRKTRSFFNLLEQLLTYEPSERITAEQALKHEFVCLDWSS